MMFLAYMPGTLINNISSVLIENVIWSALQFPQNIQYLFLFLLSNVLHITNV